MRLWTIHPSHLDRAGLLACWREGLLARRVRASTVPIGYANHPQLHRWPDVATLDAYLHGLVDEAEVRGYRFDRTKLGARINTSPIPVSTGQVDFEAGRLVSKMWARGGRPRAPLSPGAIQVHPIFTIYSSDKVEEWERGA